MHQHSHDLMKYFVDTYLDKSKELDILDVGSYDINGNFRGLFVNPKWKYTGLDIAAGPNVDVVSKALYDFGFDKKFDVVVSGNCLEHVEAPWRWIKAVEKVIKKDGLVCIVTPFSITEHRCPVDCYRILPDGYKYLLEEEANFTLIESRLDYPPMRYKVLESIPGNSKWMKFVPTKIKDILAYQPDLDVYAIARAN
jgi:SAM-dependent methyltransferase